MDGRTLGYCGQCHRMRWMAVVARVDGVPHGVCTECDQVKAGSGHLGPTDPATEIGGRSRPSDERIAP